MYFRHLGRMINPISVILLISLLGVSVGELENSTDTSESLLEAISATIEPSMEMEPEGDWVNKPKPGEIEDAKHLLDFFHIDMSMTEKPMTIMVLVIFITLLRPTLHWPIIRHIPESVALMFYGVITAACFKLTFRSWVDVSLDPFTFFLVFLPAIVGDAGMSMQKREFLQSIVKILLFAVIGTVITAVTVSGILYMFHEYFTFYVSYLHILVFGSLISAVDPVSVLSTFAEIDVKKALFTLIFGESLCNDAVTIVLYRTSINIIKTSDTSDIPLSPGTIAWDCFTHFSIVCAGGIAIGLIGAIAGVLVMKMNVGHQMSQPIFQLGFPYMMYLCAESFHWSGIVASIICSCIMSFYMASNMCVEMEFATFAFSKSGSSLSESFIFFYLGLSAISSNHAVDPWFCAITVASCSIVRFIVTCGLSAFYNLFVKDHDKIPFKDQLVVTHAGIRGAVCFGLVQTIDERIIPAKPYFVTCTLIMIGLTSVLQGCTIKYLMKVLKIPGDDGQKQADSRAFKFLTACHDKLFSRFLMSEGQEMYNKNDETFRTLGLPKAVSTALRIGERSCTDLQRHNEVAELPASIARPTISPFGNDFNADDNMNTLTGLPSTGRRTPQPRAGSRYSRHFIYTSAADEFDNYLTAPTSNTKRPMFDNYATFHNASSNNQETIERQKSLRYRRNSMGSNAIELRCLNEEPREKKLSRTVMSGNKKFVVNPEDLIREESPTIKKCSTHEQDEISKIDEE